MLQLTGAGTLEAGVCCQIGLKTSSKPMLAARPASSLPLISRLQATPLHRPIPQHSCSAANTSNMGEDLRDFQRVAVDAAKAAGAIIEAAFHQASVA